MLPHYRTSDTDLSGEPYKNRDGGALRGSVCDWCEEKGYSYMHHPLRCNQCYPDWRTKGPEQNGVTEWYIRGGGKAPLGSRGVAGPGGR